MEHRVGRFVLEFDDSLRHEPFQSKDWNGIKFFEDGYCYEVVDCLVGFGVRLIINHDDQLGYFRDMPFHEGTWDFLPSAVRVTTAPSTTG